MNRYYFDMQLIFRNGYNVNEIEKDLQMTPTKIVDRDNPKTPKSPNSDMSIVSYRTRELTEPYTENVFTKYLEKISEHFESIKKLESEQGAECVFYMVVKEQDEDMPLVTGLEKKSIAMLAEVNASWYRD